MRTQHSSGGERHTPSRLQRASEAISAVLPLKFEDQRFAREEETLASDRTAVESLMSPYSMDGTAMSLDFFDRNVTKVPDRARLRLSTLTKEPLQSICVRNQRPSPRRYAKGHT